MKKLLYILFLLLFAARIYAQQVPLYSQYMMNGFLLNPAVAGSEGYTAINLTAREQWLGLKMPRKHMQLVDKHVFLKIVIFQKELT